MVSETYLTPREAAGYLRTSVSTLAKRRLYNDAPKFCRIGTAIRNRRSDLDEFMAHTRIPSPSSIAEGGRSVMSCTSKHKIREELRDIYAEAGDDPPNVNKVWTLVKSRLPNARRRRVRDVLNEDEFSHQRRAPGKRRLPTSPGTAAAKPAGGAQ